MVRTNFEIGPKFGGSTPAPQSYTFDDMEMTETMRQAVWNVILVSDEKKLAGVVA